MLDLFGSIITHLLRYLVINTLRLACCGKSGALIYVCWVSLYIVGIVAAL